MTVKLRPTDNGAVVLSVTGTALIIGSALAVHFGETAIVRFTAPTGMCLILLAVFLYCLYGDENDDGKKK